VAVHCAAVVRFFAKMGLMPLVDIRSLKYFRRKNGRNYILAFLPKNTAMYVGRKTMVIALVLKKNQS
jgi:hypothetical protein